MDYGFNVGFIVPNSAIEFVVLFVCAIITWVFYRKKWVPIAVIILYCISFPLSLVCFYNLIMPFEALFIGLMLIWNTYCLIRSVIEAKERYRGK